MKIVEELLKWANTLPDWQSDAIRRIWINNTLSEQDENDIYGFLLEHLGIDNETKGDDKKPIRFSKDHIGSATVHGQKVSLLSIKELQNVNAIPTSEILEFGEQGMTVIYGDNSAGKSGYSRVIKKSCRARGSMERIYPNIYTSKEQSNPSNAKFIVRIDKNPPATVQWLDGVTPPDCLANIAVFDSKTARVYVDEANEVSYIPYGLDVFTKLAAICKKFYDRIQSNINGLQKMPDIVANLIGPDKVIKTLSTTTTSEDLDKLSQFSEENEKRLQELLKMVADYKANDPIKKAQEFRRQKGRIDGLRKRLCAIANSLSSIKVSYLKSESEKTVSAFQAAQMASIKAFSKEPLKGTGNDVWRLMFESAKRFSEQYAYPTQKFPVTDDNSLCVLCQQPLGIEAKDRMRRFWEFIEEDVAKISREQTALLETKVSVIRNVDLDIFKNTPQLYEEIMVLSETTAKKIKVWLALMSERKRDILNAILDNNWTDVRSFILYPSVELSRISRQCEFDAKKSESMADPKAQKDAEIEISTLDYHKSVKNNKKTLLSWVNRLQMEARLVEGRKCVDTTQISKKASTLMEQALTKELEAAFYRELDELGVDHLPIKFKRSGIKGSTYHQLQLQSNHEAKMHLSEILSEGEHTVVAIASFFAELSTSSHKCGIVFDDPVSSLDHNWRTRVATRLIGEAIQRQVVAFTHDIVFLLELEKQANERGVPIRMCSVYRSDRKSGLCDSDLPWDAKKTKKRIAYLRDLHQKLEKYYRLNKTDDYSVNMAHFYGLLRETWERAIEEVLLNDSINRFRRGIETKRLTSVKIEDIDISDINNGMTKCSTWMRGHDKSPAIGRSTLKPNELLEDLMLLDKFRKRIEDRKKAAI